MATIKTKKGLVVAAATDKAILDSALSGGVFFDYSCRNGQCGSCKVQLCEGEVAELKPQLALAREDADAGYILSCCCAPVGDVLIDAEDLAPLKDIQVKTLPAKINKLVSRTEDVVEVELRLPPTANLDFLEGQYIDVIGPDKLKRSYSIASARSKETLSLLIKKVEGGSFSEYWFGGAKENDLLRIEGPKGTFFIRGSQREMVFVATGTGIAPIKAMLDRLEQEGGNQSPITLLWGNRNPGDFFWQPEYNNITLDYIPVISGRAPDWRGEFGYVQDVLTSRNLKFDAVSIYACGSLKMIESVKREVLGCGLPESFFYSDAFVSS